MQTRSTFRKVTTRAEKNRMMRCATNELLLSFLIGASQDAIDPCIPGYKDEKRDINALIREILLRMDSHQDKEFKEI